MNNKILKKILGLFGYKAIDKELIKKDRLLSKKSFLTIDKLLENLFLRNKVNMNCSYQTSLIRCSAKSLISLIKILYIKGMTVIYCMHACIYFEMAPCKD